MNDPVVAFAAEVGPPAAGPVVAIGGRTQWEVGGRVETHDGAGVIHRAVETVGAAAQVLWREVAEHGVAWCAANALPRAV